MANTVKYGIIGVGMMGREHLINLYHLRHEGVRVVCIADPHIPSQQLALNLANSYNWNLQVQHQASVCPLRLVTCRYCGDMVQAGDTAIDVRDRMRGLNEHESACGSRTAPCASCGRSVMLKDMDIHQVAVHQKN